MKMFEKFMNVESAKSDAMELAKRPFKIPGITQVDQSETYHLVYENQAPTLFGNENNERLITLKSTLGNSEKNTVAGVAAAGDWVIDLLTCGMRKFLCVDINKFQAYIIVLKIRALQVLTFEEFDQFMIDTSSSECMAFETVKRVLQQFDDIPSKACLVFWKTIFEYSEYNVEKVRRNYIAYESLYLDHGSQRLLGGIYLKNSNEYEKAQKVVKTANAELHFEVGSIFDTKILINYTERWNTKFKLIYLSNIHNFSTSESYIAELKQVWKNCVMKSGIAVFYVIQLPSSILKIKGNAIPVSCFNADAAMNMVCNTISLVRALQKSGFNLIFNDVKTCRGFGSVIAEDEDCVVLIKKY